MRVCRPPSLSATACPRACGHWPAGHSQLCEKGPDEFMIPARASRLQQPDKLLPRLPRARAGAGEPDRIVSDCEGSWPLAAPAKQCRKAFRVPTCAVATGQPAWV